MGSLFLTSEEQNVGGSFGKERQVPFYLQFVPGYVVDIVNSMNSVRAGGDIKNINSIIAIPHISNEPQYINEANEDNRYIPLFRGMVDVPAKGDPVLLCTIGKIRYYLGPLNTGNNPNYNPDNLHKDEQVLDPNFVDQQLSQYEKYNIDPKFKKTHHSRLHKPVNIALDHPDYEGGISIDPTSLETHGDMIFEGRHGNSIRIGSRSLDPYIIMSNGRGPANIREGLGDGGIVSVTSNGSLHAIFGPYYSEKVQIVPDGMGNFASPTITIHHPNFSLASDSLSYSLLYDLPPKVRTIGDLVKQIENVPTKTPDQLIYQYDGNQVLIQSDRITINSTGIGQAPEKGGDIFISSLQDIHLGSGRHLTISTEESLIIESKNIYIGKAALMTPEEPLVLGQTLVDVLNELIDVLKEAQIMDAYGVFKPVLGANVTPIKGQLAPIQTKLKNILSSFHYIEGNINATK